MNVAPEQVFNYLTLTHGLSDAAALGILANIQTESGFEYTNATGDGGASWGLFQYNPAGGRRDRMVNYVRALGRGEWNTNWKGQVDFAMSELSSQSGWDPQSDDAAAVARWFMVKFERPADVSTAAQNARVGNLNLFSDWDTDATWSTDGAGTGTGDGLTVEADVMGMSGVTYGVTNPDGSTEADPFGGTAGSTYKVGYPTGMSLFRVEGKTFLVGKVGSARIYFDVTGQVPTNVAATYTASAADWSQSVIQGQWVHGGNASELHPAADRTWDSVIDDWLFQTGIKGTEAESDPTVMLAISRFLARPDMGEDEFQRSMELTDYWDHTTERFRTWNDTSSEDQNNSIMGTAGWLAGQAFTYSGQNLQISQYDADGDGHTTAAELKLGNPSIYQWALDVASGKKTQLQATNDFLKPQAEGDLSAPWSRILDDEARNRGKKTAEVAASAQDVQRLYARWGMEIGADQAKTFGESVYMNTMTMFDLEEKLKDMSQGLYPLKPREIDVESYSSPYRSVYQMMMERSDPGVFEGSVQSAMNAGMSLADYKNALRKNPLWQKTDNAREDYTQTFGSLGARMGF